MMMEIEKRLIMSSHSADPRTLHPMYHLHTSIIAAEPPTEVVLSALDQGSPSRERVAGVLPWY